MLFDILSQSRGCIVMMDLSDRKTIGSVSRWKEDLDSKVDKVSRSHCLLFQAELPDGRQIPALLLANKSDLRHREVRTDQVFLFNSSSIASMTKVAALHKLHGFLGWAEVSAKDDHMLTETVAFLVDAMVSKCGLSNGWS